MNRKVTAHIHSLDGKFAEVTILRYNGDIDVTDDYSQLDNAAINILNEGLRQIV